MSEDGTSANRWVSHRWPAIRARGMTRFVLVRGVLVWGGIMFVLALAMTWMKFGPGHPRFWLLLGVAAGLCLAGGLAWGVLTWTINERILRTINSNRRST